MTLVRLGNKFINIDYICQVVWFPKYPRLDIFFDNHTVSFQGNEAEWLLAVLNEMTNYIYKEAPTSMIK